MVPTAQVSGHYLNGSNETDCIYINECLSLQSNVAGPCNIFGCNCDGPCRTVDSKECPIFIQPFPTGNVYYYVKCQTEGVCDNVSQSSQNNTTNVPESAIESPFIRSCKQKLFDLYGDSLNQMLSTESGIMEYFDCMDLNGDGKLSVDEACEELQCGARQSDFDRTIVSDDIKSLSNGKDYITAAQFDADIVAAPGSSAAHDTTAHALIALIFLSLSLFL